VAIALTVSMSPRAIAQAPEPTDTEIAAALQAYANEPTVEELLAEVAALRPLDPEIAERLARRARRSGWLPTLRMAARRGQQNDISTQLADDETRVSTDDDLTLEGSLSMRLDRAFYGPNEVSLAREARSREMVREDRARLVVRAYFERRRLQLERDLMNRRGLEVILRIAELEALLDAYTAGAFSRLRDQR